MPSYCRNEDGDIFLAAESWKPNVCSSCVCLDGAISCFSESCPPVNCARPVLRKGQCCPYCLGMHSWRSYWRHSLVAFWLYVGVYDTVMTEHLSHLFTRCHAEGRVSFQREDVHGWGAMGHWQLHSLLLPARPDPLLDCQLSCITLPSAGHRGGQLLPHVSRSGFMCCVFR